MSRFFRFAIRFVSLDPLRSCDHHLLTRPHSHRAICHLAIPFRPILSHHVCALSGVSASVPISLYLHISPLCQT
ncbi:hypothetical protein L226DRAFT_533269 [Lentinus tigrinus ALCF2SS1-7]|uniref:uncharacterized protein n=1 Tax=Lentinus tigrinus ALCF2SS1-7 TaxID=1328758 RepID=UPI001165D12E|nr:hypothetical protein L226DRAFT_533269 [Lentinus tigrinus ALCF2SS1-7]